MLVDLHYSDSRADPGKQFKPAAWSNYTFAQLKQAVYDHTFAVCDGLSARGIPPAMIQHSCWRTLTAGATSSACRTSWSPGYPAAPEGQAANQRDVLSIVRAVPGGRGLGAFYWDGTWTGVRRRVTHGKIRRCSISKVIQCRQWMCIDREVGASAVSGAMSAH